ncbi:MAG: alpha/beta hydrolase [Spirochaetaceae bacterium]|nr:MAG: alpha/beta hydrolase [Spirochaetaceae bacterium]
MGQSEKKAELTADISGHLPVENGSRKVYYEYYGDTSNGRETVCLMNGLAMDCRSWMQFLPQVYPEYNVLLYNYFGQGTDERESSCEDEPYYISSFASYLVQIMDHVGVDKIHTMGVSYGGFVSGEFARAFPDRVHTATVSGILLTREIGFQHYQDLSLHFYTSTDEVFATYTRYLYEKIFGDAFLSKIYGETMEKMRANFLSRYSDRKHCLIQLTKAQDPFFAAVDSTENYYGNMQVPLLIMAGGQDRAIPLWYQEKIHTMNPGSRYMVLPECGHLTYMERADLFWPNIREFWRTKDTNFTEATK